MIVFGATLMKDAPKQEVKTSNGGGEGLHPGRVDA